ncbi:MAG: hypothetical protein JOY82_16620 [Streptosporangiaceae bacterium]|nr:hypothetical protein [Streptosporangiaceae bacterium]MBV9856117.1 hypothetical protein [Streptosporangiaceae bacterium]
MSFGVPGRRTVTAVVSCGIAAAALAGVAACSGAQPGSSPLTGGQPAATGAAAAPAHPATAATYCAQAPSSLVGSALGLPTGKLIPTVEGPVTVCAYTGTHEVIVRYQAGENAGQFASDRSSMAGLHQAVSTISGLGDSAFFAKFTTGKQPSNTLAARKGVVAVFITAPATLGVERGLMERLLSKL